MKLSVHKELRNLQEMKRRIARAERALCAYQYEGTVDTRDLPPDDLFHILAPRNAQGKAPIIEDYIIHRVGGKKVSASDDKGDYVTSDGKYVEVKISTSNKDNKLNIRQIRPWQKVDYYLCGFVDENDINHSRLYYLTKDEMVGEVNKCGKTMHGTVKAVQQNANREIGICFPVYSTKSQVTKRWNSNYLSHDMHDTILGEDTQPVCDEPGVDAGVDPHEG